MKTLQQLLNEAHKDHTEAARVNDYEGLTKVLNAYNNLLNQAPDEPTLVFLVGTVNHQLGNNGCAIQLFKRCIELQGDHAEFWNNMGSAYKCEHMNDQAKECFEKALSLVELTDYHNNLSTLYINEGNPEPGLEHSARALELDPNNIKAHWNYSLLLLETGQWEKGFDEYDAGILTLDRPNRNFSDPPSLVPYYNGEDLTGKTIVVYGEQGLGDEIMYASALPDLIKAAGTVIYECHDRLETVMRRSFPGLTIYPTRKANTIEWPRDHQIDYRIGIGSLFRWFRRDGKFPKQKYLELDMGKVLEYRQRLREIGSGPFIGFGYQGGAKKTHGHTRSTKLTPLRSILEQEATWISLQYTEEATEKFANYELDTGTKVHVFEDLVYAHDKDGNRTPGYDYDNVLHLLMALDQVILPNTTAVHACGAIGQKCWSLTPDKCAWRYRNGGPYMVMYGQWVELYRENGDKHQQIQSMAIHLANRLAQLRAA